MVNKIIRFYDNNQENDKYFNASTSEEISQAFLDVLSSDYNAGLFDDLNSPKISLSYSDKKLIKLSEDKINLMPAYAQIKTVAARNKVKILIASTERKNNFIKNWVHHLEMLLNNSSSSIFSSRYLYDTRPQKMLLKTGYEIITSNEFSPA